MIVECYYTNEFVNILQVQQIERLEHLFCCVLVTGSNVQQLGHSNQSKLLNSLHHKYIFFQMSKISIHIPC